MTWCIVPHCRATKPEVEWRWVDGEPCLACDFHQKHPQFEAYVRAYRKHLRGADTTVDT